MKRRLHRGGSDQDFQSALSHERRVRKADTSADSLDYYTRFLTQQGFGRTTDAAAERGTEEGMLFQSGRALNEVGDPKHSAPAVFMSAGIRINLSSAQPRNRRVANEQQQQQQFNGSGAATRGGYADAASRAGDDYDAFLDLLAQAEGTDRKGVLSRNSADDLQGMYGAYQRTMSNPMDGYEGDLDDEEGDLFADGGEGLGSTYANGLTGGFDEEEDDFGAFPGDDTEEGF